MKTDEIIKLILEKEKVLIEVGTNIKKHQKEIDYLKIVQQAYIVEINELFAIMEKCDEINEEYLNVIKERIKMYDS